jgi:VanZ family protein
MCRALTVLLCVYWVTLFAATHLTHVPAAVEAPGSDKTWHFVGYAGLTILLAARATIARSLSPGLIVFVAAIVILYGGVDEITQIPVGRDADIADWFADVAGAAVGLMAFGLFYAIIGGIATRKKT